MIRRWWWKFRDAFGLWPYEVRSAQLAARRVEYYLKLANWEHQHGSSYWRDSYLRCAFSSCQIGWDGVREAQLPPRPTY